MCPRFKPPPPRSRASEPFPPACAGGFRTQSHAMLNPLAAARKRILKIGDQRPAREIGRWWPNIREIELQRPRYVSLVARNVVRIYVSGKLPLETGLAGCPERIRTHRC